ncbi:tail fiber domain-containing protein [bacterium]|nr:tail fiber domain-containing protein [bacterium]
MTNARDKANIPVLNFQSKGIDDNADATAITIDSSENVGIKNTTPSNFNASANQLVVGSGSGDNGITIFAGTSNNSSLFLADGTTATNGYRGSVNYLHNGDALTLHANATETMRLTGGKAVMGKTTIDSEVSRLMLFGTSPGTGSGGQLGLQGSETTGAVNTGAGIAFKGHNGGGNRNFGDLKCQKENSSSGDNLSYMSFATRNASGIAERLRISSSGLVGIGTGSGVDKELHVQASDGSAEIRIENSAHTVRLDLSALQDTTGLNTIGSHPIFFKIASSEKMRLTSTGLGIGTSTPQTIFHILQTAETVDSGIKIVGSSSPVSGRIYMNSTDIHIDNATAGQNTGITLDTSGKTGIGTASPVSKLTVSGQVTATGGATSAPTYSFDNDTDTGISRPTTNAINFVTAGSENMRISSNGAVGINSTATTLPLGQARFIVQGAHTTEYFGIDQYGVGTYRKGGTGTQYAIEFRNDNGVVGRISVNGSATTYATSSDYRLKENVSYDFDATSRLKQLKPSRFNFIADADTTVDGFIAHEVSSIVPEAVTGTKDAVKVWTEGEELPEGVAVGDNKLDDNGNTIPDYQGIDQAKLVPLLVKTIQELEARITTLEANNP